MLDCAISLLILVKCLKFARITVSVLNTLSVYCFVVWVPELIVWLWLYVPVLVASLFARDF